MARTKKHTILPILAMLALSVSVVGATFADDEKDCADQLANLADCIPYVSGTAKKPTPKCCEDTQKVKSSKPKCLCVLIKESADPSMGLPVNTTLALQMPSVCKIDANVSECPALLNIPADSPDAKIFKQADDSSTSTTDSKTPSASSTTTPSSSTSSSSSSDSGSSLNSKSTPTSTNNGVLNSGCNAAAMIGLALVALVFI